MTLGTPTAAIILTGVALVLVTLALIDKQREDGGNPIKRKAWFRTAAIFILVSLFVIGMNKLA